MEEQPKEATREIAEEIAAEDVVEPPTEGVDNGSAQGLVAGRNGFSKERLQRHRRGVDAYEAIRRADEAAEAAIAIEQAAFAKQARAVDSVTNAVPADFGRGPYAGGPYSAPEQPLSRTTAHQSRGYDTSNYVADTNRRVPPLPLQEGVSQEEVSQEDLSKKGFLKRWFGPKAPFEQAQPDDPPQLDSSDAPPDGRYVVNPADGNLIFVPTPAPLPAWWKQQPYYAIAHLLAISATFMGAWFFGILAAQLFPGNVAKPPLQESMLRKTSRLGKSLWHFPQLWQSATTETRIEAIPLPDTGPVTKPIRLPPIERQPLIDELNSIETEVLTLDRRIQILEKQLGRPPYEGADIDQRLNSLRAAIDPPVTTPAKADYVPKPVDPSDRLLEVVERKITLPADALFVPGQSTLKDVDILNQVLDQLVNYPGATVVVRSYSDNQAGAAASREYTLAQANALSQYLQSALPEKYRWITIGGGETQAVMANETLPGRQRNRRIEILIDTR
ncbi:MAG: OmpA family protein [Cyanobacteria bacterium P01_D01_bin.105]